MVHAERPELTGSSSRARAGRTCLPLLLAAASLFAAPSPAADDTSSGVEVISPAERGVDYLRQAARFRHGDLSRAYGYAARARALAQSPAEALAAQLLLSQIAVDQEDSWLGEALAREGLRTARAGGDLQREAEFLGVIADAQLRARDVDSAFEAARESLTVANRVADRSLQVAALLRLVRAYRGEHYIDQAWLSLSEARNLASTAANAELTARVALALAEWHSGAGNFPSAEEEVRRAIEACRKGHDDVLLGTALTLAGKIARQQGRLIEAKAAEEEALERLSHAQADRELPRVHLELARIAQTEGNLSLAIEQALHSTAVARRSGATDAELAANQLLAALMVATGDAKKALELQTTNAQLETNLRRRDEQRRLASAEARYDAEHRQHQSDLRRQTRLAEDEQIRKQNNRIIIMSVTVLALIAAVGSRQHFKMRAERRVLARMMAAKDTAEQAEAFKTRLLRIASHDLKSPLAAIRAGLENLQKSTERDPEHQPLLHSLLGECRRMFRLIQDILDSSAIESGRFELRAVSLNFADLVKEIVGEQQLRAAAKKQSLTCTSRTANECLLVGDGDRLRQIVENLIDNALKFTPPGRAIHVSVEHTQRGVVLKVRDDGPGLTPEDMVRLFTPFSSLSARPTGGEPSSGLGLSITRELVTLHGGRIWVETHPNSGATFSVELPALTGAI